ncbi:MAG: type II toxin-antitoxin system HipA family toxin [Candidatus Rhabdochlamydia sp.]
MTFQNTSVVHVYFIRGQEKLSMGRLVLKDRRIFFEYNLEFIKTGLELSPLKLPLQPGIILCEDRVFEGLFGVFNDSLPDGWGKLLLDRKLMSLSLNPGDLSPLDRLCYVGKNGMGALVYEPEIEGIKPFYHDNLDEIADEVVQFQENDDNRFIDDLLAMNGSSAGARPKVVITIDKEDWIIKFRSSSDPKDIGLIEYAYHLMAKAAHLHVPEAKLFPSKKEPGYFGVKRFDRVDGRRIHMHTISGLLHADYRFPSLDYETIMKATLWLTKDSREDEKQFRAAIFNVLSHNRDDHAKNFSFLMDEKGTWRVSPAYDLTFSSGPSGEHSSMIMREGKNPTLSHLLKLAEISNIKKQKALQIIDEVKMAVAKWGSFAKELGVSPDSLKMIQLALNRVVKNIFS